MVINMTGCFVPADILLPDFSRVDGTRWAVIACDQFTSKPEYWAEAGRIAGDSYSALNLILPEAYLGSEEKYLPKISRCMREYLADGVLREYKNTMIYLERKQPDGRIRRGIVGAVDLEFYDWKPGTATLVRATEGTVPERIPPRVKIRADALLELPHIMLLADDPEMNVIEPLAMTKTKMKKAYDFELMLGGGSVGAWFIEDKSDIDAILRGLARLADPEVVSAKYGVSGCAPLSVAVGDGNHSLASAKAVYEQLKCEIGEAAREHPARYALAELVNIHDPALDFEPIYRVVFGVDVQALLGEFENYCRSLSGNAQRQVIRAVWSGESREIVIPAPERQMAVGTLQGFLDDYLAAHTGVLVDYIHGEDEAVSLARADGTVAFLFEGMQKGDLFRYVLCDGSLPRKTFSMGHAEDKRYYIEARKIVLE